MKIEKICFPHLYQEFKHLDPEEIDSWYVEVYDRWTWETNSAEDRELLEKLDVERRYRADAKNKSRKLCANWTVEAQQDIENEIGEGVEEEMVAAIAKDIAKDLEDEALKKIVPLIRRVVPDGISS
jgi:Major capsid protein Gp23